MDVYSYEQLLAIVNQQATTIAHRGAVINNLRIEREWLEEDNKLQREEVEKAKKEIADQERFAKLKEKKIKKRFATGEGISRSNQAQAPERCKGIERLER